MARRIRRAAGRSGADARQRSRHQVAGDRVGEETCRRGASQPRAHDRAGRAVASLRPLLLAGRFARRPEVENVGHPLVQRRRSGHRRSGDGRARLWHGGNGEMVGAADGPMAPPRGGDGDRDAGGLDDAIDRWRHSRARSAVASLVGQRALFTRVARCRPRRDGRRQLGGRRHRPDGGLGVDACRSHGHAPRWDGAVGRRRGGVSAALGPRGPRRSPRLERLGADLDRLEPPCPPARARRRRRGDRVFLGNRRRGPGQCRSVRHRGGGKVPDAGRAPPRGPRRRHRGGERRDRQARRPPGRGRSAGRSRVRAARWTDHERRLCGPGLHRRPVCRGRRGGRVDPPGVAGGARLRGGHVRRAA